MLKFVLCNSIGLNPKCKTSEMSRAITFATFLLIPASILLLLCCLSVPITRLVSLGSLSDLRFGIFGYCFVKGACSSIQLGYNLDAAISLKPKYSSDFYFSFYKNSKLSNAFIVHVAAAALTIITFFFTLIAHIEKPSKNEFFLIIILIISFFAIAASLLSFVIDVLFFIPHLDWGSWCVLSACILNVLVFGIVHFARKHLVASQAGKIKTSFSYHSQRYPEPNFLYMKNFRPSKYPEAHIKPEKKECIEKSKPKLDPPKYSSNDTTTYVSNSKKPELPPLNIQLDDYHKMSSMNFLDPTYCNSEPHYGLHFTGQCSNANNKDISKNDNATREIHEKTNSTDNHLKDQSRCHSRNPREHPRNHLRYYSADVPRDYSRDHMRNYPKNHSRYHSADVPRHYPREHPFADVSREPPRNLRQYPRGPPREHLREPPREHLREPQREYLREPPREYLREPSKEPPREHLREPPRGPPREHLREPQRGPPREHLREPLREHLRAPPREHLREPQREYLREPPREYLREPPREHLREPPRGPPREHLREPPREHLREPPREHLREPPREHLREPLREHRREPPKEPPREHLMPQNYPWQDSLTEKGKTCDNFNNLYDEYVPPRQSWKNYPLSQNECTLSEESVERQPSSFPNYKTRAPDKPYESDFTEQKTVPQNHTSYASRSYCEDTDYHFPNNSERLLSSKNGNAHIHQNYQNDNCVQGQESSHRLRSPTASTSSHFTSISQRGINPNWVPPSKEQISLIRNPKQNIIDATLLNNPNSEIFGNSHKNMGVVGSIGACKIFLTTVFSANEL
ncbi:hypothetical protein PORY_000921 [Pneumocystis oryctolagi]|uniref:Uncharacterized protein n=1 Tax=Pneumocystis oryctolagi TaxID=42067 RepID=A0ACB7CEK4_9ASCO|nr:hypothetical protein PORY_000921 [Pneumocystis oryctolagi]